MLVFRLVPAGQARLQRRQEAKNGILLTETEVLFRASYSWSPRGPVLQWTPYYRACHDDAYICCRSFEIFLPVEWLEMTKPKSLRHKGYPVTKGCEAPTKAQDYKGGIVQRVILYRGSRWPLDWNQFAGALVNGLGDSRYGGSKRCFKLQNCSSVRYIVLLRWWVYSTASFEGGTLASRALQIPVRCLGDSFP
jgi:hypothetical protein